MNKSIHPSELNIGKIYFGKIYCIINNIVKRELYGMLLDKNNNKVKAWNRIDSCIIILKIQNIGTNEIEMVKIDFDQIHLYKFIEINLEK